MTPRLISALAYRCGARPLGVDFPAGSDPLGTKASLVSSHGKPEARERFIAALSAMSED